MTLFVGYYFRFIPSEICIARRLKVWPFLLINLKIQYMGEVERELGKICSCICTQLLVIKIRLSNIYEESIDTWRLKVSYIFSDEKALCQFSTESLEFNQTRMKFLLMPNSCSMLVLCELFRQTIDDFRMPLDGGSWYTLFVNMKETGTAMCSVSASTVTYLNSHVIWYSFDCDRLHRLV
jgi:hypothetical protein